MRRSDLALRLAVLFAPGLGWWPPAALDPPRSADSQPDHLPDVRFHLTARPWTPVDAPTTELLDQLEPAVRALAPLQSRNAFNPADPLNGAIIDPFNRAEVPYATPLFAFNVAALVSRGRAADMVPAGARASAGPPATSPTARPTTTTASSSPPRWSKPCGSTSRCGGSTRRLPPSGWGRGGSGWPPGGPCS